MMAGRGINLVSDLSAAASRLVAENEQKLARISGEGLTLEQRAKRPWDVAAKMDIAQRIAAEEDRRAWETGTGRPHNDVRDAMRHARWSQRTAQAAGPIFAEVAGIAHEAKNLYDSVRAHGPSGPYEPQNRGGGLPPLPPTPGQTIDESRMDLRNNAEGRRAAREGRPIDTRRLQAAPDMSALSAIYRYPPAWRASSARR